ncbi:hypothetical protein [Paenibacillus puerhi]|uniref:hypothetical protein n=1 Tax=Paenibacillus puerhi TaxID=2692622 RepID=UPI00135B7986|nr:hypothetical protein [Paenibacillus puerhi]
MPTIKLHPHLHEFVHDWNNRSPLVQSETIAPNFSLSKEENSAIVNTFSRPFSSRKQSITSRESDWG